MWDCERAQALWRASLLRRWVGKTGNLSFKEICFRAASALSGEHFELFCGLVWAAWSDRNSRLFENATKSPETWVNEVAGWIESFKTCSASLEQAKWETEAGAEGWTRPCRGELKLNVDAAWSDGGVLTTVGGVIRDHSGGVVGVVAKGIQ